MAERVRALQNPLVVLIADARETPAIHDHEFLTQFGLRDPRRHALHLVLNKADLLPTAAQVWRHRLSSPHRSSVPSPLLLTLPHASRRNRRP